MLKKIPVCIMILSSAILTATEFLGPEKFWRPRENMVFYLEDTAGGGFDLRIGLRDMNVYCEGARDAFVFVIEYRGKVRKQIQFVP